MIYYTSVDRRVGPMIGKMVGSKSQSNRLLSSTCWEVLGFRVHYNAHKIGFENYYLLLLSPATILSPSVPLLQVEAPK